MKRITKIFVLALAVAMVFGAMSVSAVSTFEYDLANVPVRTSLSDSNVRGDNFGRICIKYEGITTMAVDLDNDAALVPVGTVIGEPMDVAVPYIAPERTSEETVTYDILNSYGTVIGQYQVTVYGVWSQSDGYGIINELEITLGGVSDPTNYAFYVDGMHTSTVTLEVLYNGVVFAAHTFIQHTNGNISIY